MKLVLHGDAGMVRLAVRDQEDGVDPAPSRLREDTLDLEMLAGPVHRLHIVGSGSLSASTRAQLPPLTVQALDEWGNVVKAAKGFEVSGGGMCVYVCVCVLHPIFCKCIALIFAFFPPVS